MMNTEVGSGGSFLAIGPLLWERRVGGGGARPCSPASFLKSDFRTEFNQDTVPGLSPLRRVSTFDNEHVEGVQGGSGEEIRAKGVVDGADSSRLEQKASARH